MSGPGATPAVAREIPLASLPLADHTSGGHGSVDTAVESYRAGIEAALTRDEQAQRAQELEEARQAGFAAGAAHAKAEADREGLDLLRTLPSLIAIATGSADEAARQIVDEVSEDMVAAALEIARWVVGVTVDTDPSLLLGIAQDAVMHAGGITGATVYVSGDVAAAAQSWAARLGATAPDVSTDAALGQATVRIVTASGGTADVSLPALVARAAEALGCADTASDTASDTSLDAL